MNKKNSGWFYVALIPAGFAFAGLMIFSTMFLGGWIENKALFLTLFFAFAELVMVLAGLGGVVYLINPLKTRAAKWVTLLNIGLFFSAALGGALTFIFL